MELKKNQNITAVITDVAFGGMGISKIPMAEKQFVVFVPDTIPGDEVSARYIKIKKSYAVATLQKIIKPSPLRTKPRCKHFDVCGGCTFQYLNYENQLHIKEQQVRDCIERIGGVTECEILPIIGCADPWFYRNKMEYSFGMVVAADTSAGQLSLGLHIRGRFADIFDLQECFLQSPMSVEILSAVRNWAREKKLTPYDTFTKRGLLRSLTIREGKNTSDVMVNLIVNADESFTEIDSLQKIFERDFPNVTSLFLTAVRIQRGHPTAVQEKYIFGKTVLTETLRVDPETTLSFDIHPQAFFQTNTRQAEILYKTTIDLAGPKNTDVVYDLFCGTGTIGMFFAKKAGKVFGVESHEGAVKNARNNPEKNGLKNITFFCGDVGKMLKKHIEQGELPPPDIVVIDPPRAGVGQKTLEQIMALKAKKIVYVSCNPATFARDAALMGKLYTLKKLQPVDMFPQTYHVEVVGLFLLLEAP